MKAPTMKVAQEMMILKIATVNPMKAQINPATRTLALKKNPMSLMKV